MIKLLYLICFLVLITFVGCVKQTEETVSNSTPSNIAGLEVVGNDSMWVTSDSTFHTIQVQVDGGGNPDSLFIVIHGDSTYTIAMADDGGATALPTLYPWLTASSGDVIPGDRIWTRQIRAGFAQVGRFSVTYLAKSGSSTWTIATRWSVVDNRAPVYSGLVAPDTLRSGVDSLLELSAIDPDTFPHSGVSSVVAHVYNSSGINIRNRALDEIGGGQRWRLPLPYSFPAGLITGSYRFVISATDFYGGSTDTTTNIFLQNFPPSIDSIQMYGTAMQGQTVVLFDSLGHDTVLFVFRVVMEDPQSTIDITKMHVRMNQDRNPSVVIYDSILVDGSNADPVGDGVIYSGFQLNNRNRHTGPPYNYPLYDTYHITFSGIDGGGNVSRDSTYTFYIQQPGSSEAIMRSRDIEIPVSNKAPNPFAR